MNIFKDVIIKREDGRFVDINGVEIKTDGLNEEQRIKFIELNNELTNKIHELHDEFVEQASKSIIEYYKSNSNSTKMIIEQMAGVMWAYANVYIQIVNRYSVVFLMNEDDVYTKECMKALRKIGVKNIDVHEVMKYAVSVEECAFVCKKAVEKI